MSDKARAVRTLGVLQVLDVLLALACIGYGGCMAEEYLTTGDPVMIAAGVLFIAVIIGSLAAQTAFFRLCGQLKKQQAFIQENDRTLGVIARCCGVNTALLLLTVVLNVTGSVRIILEGNDSMITLLDALNYSLNVDGYFLLLLTFVMGSAALIAWVLQLLMRRAVALQQENDATV